jgi:DNA-binding CsgD family transcriptional regulator
LLPCKYPIQGIFDKGFRSDIKSHMSNLTEKDYQEILNTLYTVNCCDDTESFINTLMTSTVRIFHSECITFHLIKGYPGDIEVLQSRAFKLETNEISEDKVFPALYTAGLYHKSPLLQEAIATNKTVLKTGESISFKDWEKSDLYNNFILPQNLYRELFVTLRWKDRLEGMITLWRSRNERDYLMNDVDKAEMLAPHLIVAVHNVSATSKLHNLKKNFAPDGETSREGLLILDHKHRPVYFNNKARHMCLQLNGRLRLEADSASEKDFPIPAPILADCSELSHQLKTDERPILWPKERVVLGENNIKFLVECSLVWRSDQVNPRPNFIINMKDLTDDHEPGADLQSRFHLSKRELDIIYCIVKGMSYGEIADKLFISKLTVHTHVKNIYRKLGTKNRIELYRYIQSPNWP